MSLDGLPDRPLRLHELTVIENNNEAIINIEPVFYKGDNINGAIFILINVNETANLIGFHPEEENWVKITDVNDADGDKRKYMKESDNVIDWVNDMYGEEYGIYGNYEGEKS